MATRWMLYSHDALGLGHVRRMLAIARAALANRPDLAALLVTCSPLVDALPMPDGIDYVKLPSARKVGPRDYRPRTLEVDQERFRALREAVLRETGTAFAPDLLLADKSPLGLMGELASTLDRMKDGRRSQAILGWRDILDEPGDMREEWRLNGTLDVLERTYDEIWVYGDDRVLDVRTAYHLPDSIAARVRHLGYLAPRVSEADRIRAREVLHVDGAPLAVVTVGGGESGERVVDTYFEVLRRRLLDPAFHTLVITGPLMAEADQRRLAAYASPRAQVVPFMPGLEAVIAAADVVVGRAGYNTVCEALGSATPAVFIPRVLHRGEQSLRARRLADLGLAQIVDEPDLTPASLARAVRRALRRGRVPSDGVRMDGLSQVAQRISALLPRDSALLSA